jgi:nucleotide-binding universal stress UspA family protein
MRTTIIVGYDGDEHGERALDRAIEEARNRSGRLVVVAVEELPLDPTGPRNFGTLDDGSPAPVVEPPELARLLGEARERVRGSRVEADYVWAAGDPARAIVDLARERKASLIVIGAGHEGFFTRLFGLGVADEVKRDAGCDVLLVP